MNREKTNNEILMGDLNVNLGTGRNDVKCGMRKKA